MQISMSFAAFLAAILFISAPLAQAQTAEDQAALAALTAADLKHTPAKKLFGAKKLRNVGSDLGAAVRGFKKSMNEGDDETTRQLNDQSSKDADFKERSDASKSDSKPAA